MKTLKLLSALVVVFITLTSCESDPIDWSTPKQNAKIKGERLSPGSNAYVPDTWEFLIENNTLTGILKTPSFGSFEKDILNYSSGRIVSVEHYNNQEELLTEDIFSYNTSNLLESIITYDSNNKIIKSRYFNYSDPVYIQETSNLHDASEAVTYTLIESKRIVNNNLLERFDSNNNQVTTYTYDDKTNVFSTLNNLPELVLYYSSTSYRINFNNKLSTASIFSYNGTVLNTTSNSFSNQYDEQNRITESIKSGAHGTKEIFTY